MITVEALTKTYPNGVRALDQICLELGIGTFGLLGPNGAGKTTLMRILAGLLQPTSGKVTIYGHDVIQAAGQAAVKKMLGYLPQELGLPLTLTVEQTLDYFALLKRLGSPGERAKETGKVFEHTGLSPERRKRVKTLSGGQKRRLGVAIALLGNPRLLIVDEPSAGLDPAERVRFRNILTDLGQDRIVLLSTHIVEDVTQTCHRLAVIRAGRLLYCGTPATLITRMMGHVWTICQDDVKDLDPARVISTNQTGSGIEYRFIGDPISQANPAQPTLEDAYLGLMNGIIQPQP